MKISKVDHTKTAVGVIGGAPKGIIYQYPSKGVNDVEKKIDGRVESVNKAAKYLYKLLNDRFEDDERATDEIKKVVELVNDSFKNAIKNGSFDVEQFTLNITRKAQEGETVITEKNIEDAVLFYLKKTLKNSSCPDELIRLIKSSMDYRIVDAPNADSRRSKKSLENLINNDFKRYNVRNNAKESIENQNMLFQPDTKDGWISLSRKKKADNANSIKVDKKAEKDGLETFLVSYANLDQTVRNDLLLRLRRILVLYFYGIDEAKKVIDNPFEDHEKRKSDASSFFEMKKREVTRIKKTEVKKVGGVKETQDTLETNEEVSVVDTKAAIRESNMACYRVSVKELQNYTELFFETHGTNMFWIHHISNAVERILIKHKIKGCETYKTTKGYISEKVWKDMINFISIKYIALGKAVYHFALSDINSGKNELDLGRVDADVKGISSFDYEYIKAEETLQREISTYVAHAINHIAQSTVVRSEKQSRNDAEHDEDFLGMKFTDNKFIKPNTSLWRNIFQFFGGQSAWTEWNYFELDGNDKEENALKIIDSFKEILASMRNENFHFKTNLISEDWNKDLIASMIKYEGRQVSGVIRDKYYSNNLYMFYNQETIKKVLRRLYDNNAIREAQIPSFNRICSRKKLD